MLWQLQARRGVAEWRWRLQLRRRLPLRWWLPLRRRRFAAVGSSLWSLSPGRQLLVRFRPVALPWLHRWGIRRRWPEAMHPFSVASFLQAQAGGLRLHGGSLCQLSAAIGPALSACSEPLSAVVVGVQGRCDGAGPLRLGSAALQLPRARSALPRLRCLAVAMGGSARRCGVARRGWCLRRGPWCRWSWCRWMVPVQMEPDTVTPEPVAWRNAAAARRQPAGQALPSAAHQKSGSHGNRFDAMAGWIPGNGSEAAASMGAACIGPRGHRQQAGAGHSCRACRWRLIQTAAALISPGRDP